MYPAPPYDLIRIHKLTNDSAPNFIGYDLSAKSLYWYHPGTLAVYQSPLALNATEDLVDIRPLKKFLLVITTENVYRLLFTNGAYTPINLYGIENKFGTFITPTEVETKVLTDQGDLDISETDITDAMASELLGKYFKAVNEKSAEGKYIGGVFFRTALRLYDGTEVLQTLPTFVQLTNNDLKLRLLPGTSGKDGYYFQFEFAEFAKIRATQNFVAVDAAEFNYFKDIIQSVVVYASRIQYLYDVSEITITKDNLIDWTTDFSAELTGAGRPGFSMGEVLPVSDAFKKDLHDSAGWYKLGEMAFNELTPNSLLPTLYEGVFSLDDKDYFNNYATREKIDVDNFSHHQLTGNGAYMYNSRLHLFDTTQTLGLPLNLSRFSIPGTLNQVANPYDPAPELTTYIYDTPGSYDTFVQVKLNTADGTKYVSTTGTIPAFVDDSNATKKAIFLPGIFGYPDNRAVELVLCIKIDGQFYEVVRKQLKSSNFENFAYAINDNFDPAITGALTGLYKRVDGNFISTPYFFRTPDILDFPRIIIDDAKTISDSNRLQPSEVDNPFVFPVKDSVQVSTSGTILTLGTNTEDVSSGQYGEYPIYAFTDAGIWGLGIGTGDVYITRIDPLSGEVLKTPAGTQFWQRNNKLDLPFGIAFVTSEGVKIIAGKEVVDISDPVKGLPDKYLLANPNLQFFLNHSKTVQMTGYIDQTPFRNYLTGAGLYLNKGFERSEIVIYNPLYAYSYVYDIVGKYWYKLTGQFGAFIPYYPELWVVNISSSKVVNFSKEIDGPVQCLFITRAFAGDAKEVFRKMRRSFLRCHLTTSLDKRAAGYLFESDNLKSWKFVTGNDRNTGEIKDIWLTHSLHSARYNAYVFCAELAVNADEVENRISNLECEYDFKFQSKLR